MTALLSPVSSLSFLPILSAWLLPSPVRSQSVRELKDETGDSKAVIYSSDLKRAKQTADAIAAYLNTEPILRTELRERDLGRCCGKSVQWLRENMEGPEKTVDDRLFSDGESRRDAWNRLKPFYEEIMAGEDELIILVSHGDLLSSWTAMFLGFQVEDFYRVDIHGPAGSVSHMFVEDDGKHKIRHINDMSYIL